MNILVLDPEDEQAQYLIEQSDEYLGSLYPPESNHLEDTTALQKSNVLFLGAYEEDRLVGCGAVKVLDEDGDGVYGEIKRIFVPIQYRGQGISMEIMNALEAHLRESGITIARLETGIKQEAAIGLYRKLGYRERGPFGTYRDDPWSLFMEKQL